MLCEGEFDAVLQNEQPKIFLISGGGNDLLDDQRLKWFLNEYSPANEADPKLYLNDDYDIFLNILNIKEDDQHKIAQNIETFATNLTYLLVLLDNLNSNTNNLEKVRRISEFLGYSKDLKISLLRENVESDFFSLQWSQRMPDEDFIY